MIDYGELANQVGEMLKPFLAAAGGTLAEKAVQAGYEKAVGIYQWMKQKFTSPAAAEALTDVTENPENETNWEALVLQIHKALEKDEDFRKGLMELMPAKTVVKVTNQTQTATGDHNIQIQQSGSGGKIEV